jgi:hypothetical protein
MPAINLMMSLKHGREPSMYTDIRSDSSSIQVPSTIVSDNAAFDCIRLATDCLSHTQRYILEKSPEPRTRAQDQLFAMKSAQFLKLANTEDFWWYYIEQLETGRKDFAEAVISYYENYARVGVQFGRPS